MVHVSVIILSYNTKELLKKCLESIEKHMKGLSHEVIVVDNASSDDSVKMLEKQFKNTRLIKNTENAGFAKGVNQGAREARGEYLLLLNSDTEFGDDSIKNMISFAKTDPDIAVVGGYLKNADNSTSKSFGKFYTLKGVYEMLFHDRAGMPRYENTTEVDWVSGGYMLIRKEIFQKLSGFDEHFFMYLEDMELCFRVKKMGKKVMYYPASEILHIGQGSSNRTFAIVQIYKGLVYFYRKHKSYPEYLMLKLMLTIKALSACTIGLLSGNTYLMNTYRKALVVVL